MHSYRYSSLFSYVLFCSFGARCCCTEWNSPRGGPARHKRPPPPLVVLRAKVEVTKYQSDLSSRDLRNVGFSSGVRVISQWYKAHFLAERTGGEKGKLNSLPIMYFCQNCHARTVWKGHITDCSDTVCPTVRFPISQLYSMLVSFL